LLNTSPQEKRHFKLLPYLVFSAYASVTKKIPTLCFIFVLPRTLYYTNTSITMASMFACYFNRTIKSQAFLPAVYRTLNVASKVLAT